LPSTYKTFGEAHAQAVRMAKSMPSTVMAKKASYYKTAREGVVELLGSEDNIVAHFNGLVDIIGERVSSLEAMDDEDEKDDEAKVVVSEIDGVLETVKAILKELDSNTNVKNLSKAIDELKKMRLKLVPKEAEKVAPLNLEEKQASKVGCDAVNNRLAETVVRTFAEAAMGAIQPSHAEVFVGSVTQSPDKKIYATLSESIEGGAKDLILMVFGSDLLLRRVVPLESVGESCPYQSDGFFEKYWEPIVSAVGHIRLDGINTVAVPGVSGSGWDRMGAFGVEDGSKKILKVSYSEGRPRIWWIQEDKCDGIGEKIAASKFKQSDLIPGVTEVRCINKDLPTYYGRTGKLVKISPRRDYAEISVDFRRGLGVLNRMTDADIELVQLPS